jgi:hypothetical protein
MQDEWVGYRQLDHGIERLRLARALVDQRLGAVQYASRDRGRYFEI